MSKSEQYTQGVVDTKEAVILSGESKSGIVDTWGTTMTQLEVPNEFDGTRLTFETSSNRTTFGVYKNIDGVEVAIDPVEAGVHYGIAAQDFFPVRYVKIVSNAIESGDRSIRLIPKAI